MLERVPDGFILPPYNPYGQFDPSRPQRPARPRPLILPGTLPEIVERPVIRDASATYIPVLVGHRRGRAPGGSVGSVVSISRQMSPAGGGAVVTVVVTALVGSPPVALGGTPATSVSYNAGANTITCTLPAYPGTPAQLGSPTDLTVGDKTLANAVTYFQGETVRDCDENLNSGSAGVLTLSDVNVGTVAISTDRAYSGLYSLKCSITALVDGGCARVKFVYGGATKNPMTRAQGVCAQWYEYIPAATVAEIIKSGQGGISGGSCQMKNHIWRVAESQATYPGWFMGGMGNDFPPGNGTQVIFSDPDTGGTINVQTGLAPADRWREHQVRCIRVGGRGYMWWWTDGLLVASGNAVGFGSDDPTARYDFDCGIDYAEVANPIVTYIGGVRLGDAPFNQLAA